MSKIQRNKARDMTRGRVTQALVSHIKSLRHA